MASRVLAAPVGAFLPGRASRLRRARVGWGLLLLGRRGIVPAATVSLLSAEVFPCCVRLTLPWSVLRRDGPADIIDATVVRPFV
jgi:hypothetical protein